MLYFVLCRFLKAEEHEDTANITQHDITDVVDITSAQKVSGRLDSGL